MSNTSQLLKVTEVAARLGMRESGIRRWIARRLLPVVRLNRMVRVPLEAVEELISANTVPARRSESLPAGTSEASERVRAALLRRAKRSES